MGGFVEEMDVVEVAVEVFDGGGDVTVVLVVMVVVDVSERSAIASDMTEGLTSCKIKIRLNTRLPPPSAILSNVPVNNPFDFTTTAHLVLRPFNFKISYPTDPMAVLPSTFHDYYFSDTLHCINLSIKISFENGVEKRTVNARDFDRGLTPTV